MKNEWNGTKGQEVTSLDQEDDDGKHVLTFGAMSCRQEVGSSALFGFQAPKLLPGVVP